MDLDRFNPQGPKLDLDALSGLPPAPEGTLRVGLVATMARWKGHEVFLHSLSILPKELPIRGYVIGGPIYATAGSQYSIDELKNIASTLGLNGNIGFTGYVSEPGAAMRALDVVVHASIHRRIDGEGIVIYEARIGEPDDAASYRRALQEHLEKLRWYRAIGRWMNPGGVRRVAFMRTFRVVPDAGAKDKVVAKLANLVELVVGQVAALKLAILHEGLDRPLEIMLYEEWDDTKEGFLANEAPKSYRTAYRDETADLVAERGDLEWLSPIRIYQGKVTNWSPSRPSLPIATTQRPARAIERSGGRR